jgi:pimeloyl-ACP methyl ester carboxylesterase
MPRSRSVRFLSLFVAVACLVSACGDADRAPSPSAAVSSAVPSGSPSVTGTPPPAASALPSSAPGPSARSVTVDGRDVAIDCRGEGQPTVILESGLGVPMQTWDAVIAQVATTARVCRYERPTVGSVDPKDLPRTADRMVEQLRALLTAAGEGPPYVVVGQALGGLTAQLFARTHPDEVLGVVFVDAIHPDLDKRIEALLTPAQVAARRSELERNPEGITFEDILRSEQLVKAAPPFPPVATAVIRHGLPIESTDPAWPTDAVEKLWTELASDLATLGDPPREVVVAEHSHRIEQDEPGVVVDAIVYALEAMR